MPRSKVSISDRFWPKVKKTETCWNWTASKDGAGYGQLARIKQKNGTHTNRAHRVSLMIMGVEIPDGMVVDHVCRNKSCVNPAHLRIVTQKINTIENSDSWGSINSKKTHCKRGHLFNLDNLMKSPSLKHYRVCKICTYERQNLKRSKHKGNT